MRKLGLSLIVFFALTTVAAFVFAVREHRLAADNLAAAEKSAAEEKARWEKRLAEAQQRLRDLETELAAARDHDGAGEQLAASSANGESAPARGGPRGGRRNGESGPGGNLLAMMDNPEFAQLWTAQQRGLLDDRYADLFKNLKLSPAELEKFKNLLVEKQTSFRDVVAAARAEGLDPRESRDQMRQLMQQANQEIDHNIQSVLGADGFAQYKQYEQTLPQRNLVSQLDRRLSYSSTPLNQAQSEQLVQILAQNSPSTASNQGGGFRGGMGMRENNVTVTDQAIAQASGVLTPAQVSGLQQLQAEQQAQQQMYQTLRQQRASNPNAPTGPPNRTTPAPKSPSS